MGQKTDLGHVAITGASSGIGEACARDFAAHGARLSLVARRKPLLDALAASLPGGATAIEADLLDLDHACDWIDAAEAANGPIDVAVLNAGMQYVEPAEGVGAERAKRLQALNFDGPMRQAERLLPGMRERGRGTIVVVASLAAIVHTPYMAHYNASKAALAAYFETLGVELAGTGVHVVVVYPGPVTTPLEKAARDKLRGGGRFDVADQVPTGTPERLAALVRAAIVKRKGRVVYPKAYEVARHLRVVSQWMTNRLTPKPR
ncbi:MAG: SDR family NAD(P)-dependent oxidoreductase [Deltaproteobacteria bacterium]|nr:SDR family NAD(P)-dependent oxidoreductase [Deltaproteobacteria bacterium]